MNALMVLAKIRMSAPYALEDVLEAMRDPRPKVRYYAIGTIVAWGIEEREVAEALRSAAGRDPDEHVRMAASEALSRMEAGK